MSNVNIGIIDVMDAAVADTVALAAWVVLDKISMLTGFFGKREITQWFVQDLAQKTRAISWTPVYQAIRDRNGQAFFHPSFFLFFGFYIELTAPEEKYIPAVANTSHLGEDF